MESTRSAALFEARFREQLHGKQLIGELHLTRDDFDALRAADGIDASHWTTSAKPKYPLAQAVALVFSGVYGYEGNNFWNKATEWFPSLERRHVDWLRTFETVIATQHLEQFQDFPHNALRYVSRILAHGGIPNHCLTDYFALVNTALSRPEWVDLSPHDLIAEWRARAFSFIACDLPVQRFLIHGGLVAEDFLQRTIDMAAISRETRQVPDATSIGLPLRVVDAFRQWFAKSGPVHHLMRLRIAAPTIRYDPWSQDGLILDLPAQIIADTRMAHWAVLTDAGTQRVTPRPSRTGEPALESVQVHLDRPSSIFDIALRSESSEPARWSFPGLRSHAPLLAFDASTGKLLRWTDALPARPLVLIMPEVYHDVLDEASQSIVTEVFPQLVGGWQGYRAVCVDLTDARSIQLAMQGRPVILPVHADAAATRRPRCTVDDDALAGVTAGKQEMPVVSRAPSILLPLIDGDGSESDAERIVRTWSLQVTHHAEEGDTTVARPLGDLAWGAGERGTATVDLQQARLLGEGSFGMYTVTVRGPLGRDARFSFALVPGLRVDGRAHPVVTDTHSGRAVATLGVSAASNLRMTPASPDTVVTREAHGNRLTVTGTTATPTLRVTSDAGAALDVRIDTPWARWAIQGIGDHSALAWSSGAVIVPRDALVEAFAPALRIEGLFVSDIRTQRQRTGRATLSLRTSGEIHTEETEVHGATAWFALARFRTTIQATMSAILPFTLNVWDTSGRHVVVDQPVMRVTRDLSIRGLRARDALCDAPTVEGGQDRELVVSWTEPYTLEHRHVRLWRLAEPWEPPLTIAIPADASGEFRTRRSIADLPPGPYRLELCVIDPWLNAFDRVVQPRAPRSAEAENSAVVDIILGSDDERAARVAALPADAIGLLTGYLLQRNPDILRTLRTSLAGEDVAPALRVLMTLAAADGGDVLGDEEAVAVAIDALRESIATHQQFLSMLADLAAGEGNTQLMLTGDNESLIRLVGALGLAQEDVQRMGQSLAALTDYQRTTLERRWPPFFLSSQATLREVASRIEHAEALFGRPGLDALLGPQEEPAAGTHPPDRAGAILMRFGHREPKNATKGSLAWACTTPVAQLHSMRDDMARVPRTWFDDGRYHLALLDWLIATEDAAHGTHAAHVAAWVDRAYDRCVVALQRYADDVVAPGGDCGTQVAQALVAMRMPRSDTHLGAKGWMELLPYTVATTALIQRLYARCDPSSHAILFGRDYWREQGRQAAAAAPALYTHDLCLMDLVLMPNGKPEKGVSDDRRDVE